MDGMEDDDDMTDGRHRLSVPWPPTILSSLVKFFVALLRYLSKPKATKDAKDTEDGKIIVVMYSRTICRH